MRRFDELDTYLVGDAAPGLVLTIAGKDYPVPPPSAEVGLWCERIAATAGAVNSASTEAEITDAAARIEALPDLGDGLSFPERILSPAVYKQMLQDRVDHIRLRIAAMTAYIWIVASEEQAGRYWRAGGRPEALRPAANRAQRRASNSTAAGNGTPKPESTSGTTSRNRSNATARARARRSHGRRS